MKRFTKPLIAASLLAGAALAAIPAFAHGPGGQGWGMGSGMMGYGGMMGPGMMMGGPGSYGMMGYGAAPCHDADDVAGSIKSDADVKDFLGKRLEWMGNKRLKVGTVEKTGDDTWVAEIVTVDGSLVDKIEVNSKTGFMHHVE